MIKLLTRLFQALPEDPLVEGWYADQYQDDERQKKIRERYRQCWPDPNDTPTPLTHPWLFDPCSPPQGWRYDPYYEHWQRQ